MLFTCQVKSSDLEILFSVNLLINLCEKKTGNSPRRSWPKNRYEFCIQK